jgi:predicted small metal-binding protein
MPSSYNEDDPTKEEAMAKQITCECGYVIRGNSEAEVIQGARDHMRADHPELLDKVSEDDVRNWIEEV